MITYKSADEIINVFIKQESLRYFILHFIFNMYIIYLLWNSFIYCLLNPLNVFEDKYNKESMLSTLSIMNFHLYHLLSHNKELPIETLVHHLIGAILNPLLTIFQPIGKLPVMHNIILCGIPGGIDYLLLVLFKYGVVTRMQEKKINRFLNLLIRWPFIFLSNYIYLLNIYNQNIMFSIYVIFGVFINNYNAIYFCDKVIGNYYLCDDKLKVKT